MVPTQRNFTPSCFTANSFRDHSDLFPDGTTKVNYVLSHLKGSALECFKPGLLDPTMPTWASDFNLFITELEANFRTYNPVGEAEAELEGLHMQENHQATKYFIKFMQLAAPVEWGQATLLQQAYNSLTKRIKNDLVFTMTSPLVLLRLRLEADSKPKSSGHLVESSRVEEVDSTCDSTPAAAFHAVWSRWLESTQAGTYLCDAAGHVQCHRREMYPADPELFHYVVEGYEYTRM